MFDLNQLDLPEALAEVLLEIHLFFFLFHFEMIVYFVSIQNKQNNIRKRAKARGKVFKIRKKQDHFGDVYEPERIVGVARSFWC